MGRLQKLNVRNWWDGRSISARGTCKQTYNIRVVFLLAGLAAKALPSILGGLATGLVSGAVKRAVGGDGLYLVKSGHCGEVEPVKGNGLYLTPHRGGGGGSLLGRVHGDGLYLKRGSTIQEGSGLILGANSPFKNIPILYLLLWTVLL